MITSDYVVKIDYDPRAIKRWGGCEEEMRLYAQAKADGFDYLFAKITRYEYEGYTFYIMPRIKGIGKYEDDAWKYMSYAEWDWCHKHRLCDLHSFNYGWRNGQVCLIDYGANG
jgi:hypothetical protein